MSTRMKIIRERDDIGGIDEKDECLYIGFRPSSRDLLIMVQKAPELKAIYMPKSYFKTLSKSMIIMLEMKNIQVKDEGIQNNDNITSCYVLADDLNESEDPNTPGEEDEGEDPNTPGEEDKEEANEQYGNSGLAGAVPKL